MTKEEYEKRFYANSKVEGFGLDVQMRCPCPFCAAPDFMVYKVLEVEAALQKGGTCVECGRGMKAILTRCPQHGTSIEMYQTAGDDPPDYCPPMRRLN